MAVFGTPTVIGTLTSSTSQTSYTVPISVNTGTSFGVRDSVVVVVASNATVQLPSSITDSRGQTYTMYNSAQRGGSFPQNISYWQIFQSLSLTGNDTLTVTFPTADTSLKEVTVVKLPGVGPSPAALDSESIASNSAGAPPVSVPCTVSGFYELVIFATSTANSGGSPTGFDPSFTTIQTLHSGSGEYSTVSYAIVYSAGTVASSCSTTAGGWAALTVGMFANLQPQNIQVPFTIDAFYPSLSFNPSLTWAQPQFGQPPNPTIISSGPVSVPGAQSNVFTPGVNFLTGNNTNFNSGRGNWVNKTNSTVTQTNAVSHNAAGALSLAAVAAGDQTAASSAAGSIQTQGMVVNPGDSCFAAGWILTASVSELCQIGIQFFDSNGNTLAGSNFGTQVTDNTTTWQLVTTTATAPALAAYARVLYDVTNNGIGEIHYVSDVWMFDITTGSGMPGIISVFSPSPPQNFFTYPVLPNPLYLIPQLQFLPRQIQTTPAAVFEPGDNSALATVAVAAPPGTVNVAMVYMPQNAWKQILPGLQFIPSLNWVVQQISTSNAPTYIDGGAGGQVSVNAQFSDMATTIVISATVNVSVVAQVPLSNIPGVTANVNVVARNGTVTESATGTVANVNVSAKAGSSSDIIIGTAANVNVASTSQITTVSVAGITAKVNVAAIAGTNTKVSPQGNAANVNVASVASTLDSMIGSVASVNVAAIAGSKTLSVSIAAANINVASTGSTKDIIIGSVANVSVAAIPGSTQGITGLTGKVNVVAITSAPAVSPQGTTTHITTTAIAGSMNVAVTGMPANVKVTAIAGLEGPITITAVLVNPDLAEDLLLSDQGKLLDDPVSNMLVSATTSLTTEEI